MPKMVPRGWRETPGRSRGRPWRVGFEKAKKNRSEVNPGGARFGALWGPLGVRRMLFGRKNGFMDVFFTCFISNRFSIRVFIDFLTDFREVKEYDFIAFFNLLPFEFFLRTVKFT